MQSPQPGFDPVTCSITAASLVCMVSVVDFRGSWKQAFDDRTATRELFHESDSRSTSVIMVHQTGRFRFAKCPDLRAMVVELPYEKPGRASMSAASVSLSGICTPASGCVTPAM
ncbi:hypothetical protein HPB51_010501 [Rhipicephalus microplus]|uniref:Serpin domain-containing protein n=1 Tax=Rhipicephalus microplus TaxID=6941 RepID=A0A9J6DZY6_RHIMP|nr:hypothetical protein HPB51_010501 [Rhipicephalus microplus]